MIPLWMLALGGVALWYFTKKPSQPQAPFVQPPPGVIPRPGDSPGVSIPTGRIVPDDDEDADVLND